MSQSRGLVWSPRFSPSTSPRGAGEDCLSEVGPIVDRSYQRLGIITILRIVSTRSVNPPFSQPTVFQRFSPVALFRPNGFQNTSREEVLSPLCTFYPTSQVIMQGRFGAFRPKRVSRLSDVQGSPRAGFVAPQRTELAEFA